MLVNQRRHNRIMFLHNVLFMKILLEKEVGLKIKTVFIM